MIFERNLLTFQISYDANGRQNHAAAANGSGPVTAVFDGAGQRVANKANGVLTIMVYDAGGKLLAEYGTTAPTTANLQYVTADYQGSTRLVTSSSGAIANRRDYLPFGEEIGAGVGSRNTDKGFDSGDMVRQKYAGMETDDVTSMAHTLWRKQDNLSGRWTSPDPYGGSMTTADPQSFNRYTYCNNDPVNLVDSSGLMSALPNGHDREKKPILNEEAAEELSPLSRSPLRNPHDSGGRTPDWGKTGGSGAQDANWNVDDDGFNQALKGYKRVVNGDKVTYEWVNDSNVHDVPNNHYYIDTNGNVIRLFGDDATNLHSWGTYKPDGSVVSDQSGAAPAAFATYDPMHKMLIAKGYELFSDVLHPKKGFYPYNYAQRSSPTWHWTIFIAQEHESDGIPNASAPIPYVDGHRDQNSPVGSPVKHVAVDFLAPWIKRKVGW